MVVVSSFTLAPNVSGAGVGGILEVFTLMLDKCNPKFESKNIMLEFSPLTLAPCYKLLPATQLIKRQQRITLFATTYPLFELKDPIVEGLHHARINKVGKVQRRIKYHRTCFMFV